MTKLRNHSHPSSRLPTPTRTIVACPKSAHCDEISIVRVLSAGVTGDRGVVKLGGGSTEYTSGINSIVSTRAAKVRLLEWCN